jgi:hypothetical protein
MYTRLSSQNCLHCCRCVEMAIEDGQIRRARSLCANAIFDKVANLHLWKLWVLSKNWFILQAGELSENSLISEIFVSTSEKILLVFLLNAYAFRYFLIFRLNFQRFFPHCVLHPDSVCFFHEGCGWGCKHKYCRQNLLSDKHTSALENLKRAS